MWAAPGTQQALDHPPILDADHAPAALQAIALPTKLAVDRADWDAQWDESGSHLAIWVGQASDANLGKVSFLTIDPATENVGDGR